MRTICDRNPCTLLKKALIMLAYRGAENTLEFMVVSNHVDKLPMRVTLEYCPFCGTRVDPEWITEMKKAFPKRS